MNLYQLHNERLKHHDKRHIATGSIAYEMLKNEEITDPNQKKKAISVIMKDPKWAYIYACDVLKNRWLEAESLIMKYDQETWERYKEHFNIK